MAIDSSSERRSTARARRVYRIACDVLRRREAGETLTDKEVLASYPEWAKELSHALKKLQQISSALQRADEDRQLRTLQRIQSDCFHDGSAADSTNLRSGAQSPGSCRPTNHSSVGESLLCHTGEAADPRNGEEVGREMIGRYAVIRILGTGGFGRVYQARDLHLDRDVAVKVPHQQPVTDREFHDFLNEARVAAQIDHPAIVPVYDAGKTEEDECYVVSKMIIGQNLADRIKVSRLGHREAAKIAMTVAEALHDAHSHGLVHRDIKPANILLDEEMNPYLADFGLALKRHDELQRICLKLLAKRAANRYPNSLALLEDLQCFLQRSKTAAGPLVVDAGSPVKRAVPKGLRPFEAEDADSFVDLVPGPRDRDQMPERIRQWKQRIEADARGESFCVGVMYGPLGCGKSSLIRAGILPRLANRIHSVYVSATSEETESNILQRVRKLPCRPAGCDDLVETLFAFRDGRGLAPGEKVLLVIDQFEQWLHGRVGIERSLLVQALRQCAGEHLQCLLLVRDDFWLAISRFMDELEIDLVQGQNAALVDLFDPLHARKVLMSFGRALNPSQTDLGEHSPLAVFVDRAIKALTEDDRIVPVRLALFAEMVKNRPWVPATIRSLGGAAGIGVAFLDETFSSRSANPQSRFHEQAARAVLAALLPEPTSTIKGHVRSYPELLEISGYALDPRAFKALIRILESETRLITPADPREETSNLGQRYYQLTHDYLVPALREWLTKRQKLTWRGRVERTLADRSMMWSVKRERRQLPSIWEWSSIRVFTAKSSWNPLQREMMRSAVRHHALVAALLVMAFCLFRVTGSELGGMGQRLLLGLRANVAGIWLALGHDQKVWPLLQHSADPTERTRVIHGMSLVVTSPESLLSEVPKQTDPSIRRAMLLMAGELVLEAAAQPNLPATVHYSNPPPDLVSQLVAIFRTDPDPGVHAAAEWTLRVLVGDEGMSHEVARWTDKEQHHRGWSAAVNGHTMIEIQPVPYHETERVTTIQHSFYLASKETTRDQYEQFCRDRDLLFPAGRNDVAETPQTDVRWREAAAYCNWLSEQAAIPQEQWCYRADSLAESNEAPREVPSVLQRRGFRLPTEAEWEYACRSLSTSKYSFGNSTRHLAAYAVARSADLKPDRVGRHMPNDFGFFDMHGNVAEWCHNPTASATGLFRSSHSLHAARGGSCWDAAEHVTSASRRHYAPATRRGDLGFRVAITMMP